MPLKSSIADLSRLISVSISASAHKLKGSVSNFTAQPVFEATLKLEDLSREVSISEAGEAEPMGGSSFGAAGNHEPNRLSSVFGMGATVEEPTIRFRGGSASPITCLT